eukprot:10696768-Alexandrium_andersonii.AAC.1
MSASLVGSEMCIRDSVPLVAGAAQRAMRCHWFCFLFGEVGIEQWASFLPDGPPHHTVSSA